MRRSRLNVRIAVPKGWVLPGLALLLILVAATPALPGPNVNVIRVVFRPFQNFGALFIADHEGYFTDERIRIEWVTVRNSAEVIPLLGQGALDVGAAAITPAFFNGASRGLQVRVVADKGHLSKSGSQGLMVRSGLAGVVKSVPDLKGRRLAHTTPGDLGHYLWHRLLALHRMTLDQVTLVQLPLTVHPAALEGGSVDAALIDPPRDSVLAEAGIAVKLANVADFLPGQQVAFLFYGPNLLDRDRPLGIRFMIGYLRGLRRYNEGATKRNVAIVSKYTEVEPDLIQRSGWVGIRADGMVDVTGVRRQQDWLYGLDLIATRNPMSSVVDQSFVDQANAVLEQRGTR